MMKRTVLMLAALLCLMSMMLTLGGCQIIDRIFGGDDGDEESDARIATLEEQALAIGESIEALRLVDAQLGAYIDALEESGEGSEQSIASLKSNQSSLEGRIKSLEDLRDGLATKEWAEGAFVTLEQQVAVQNDLDSIRASLATVQTDLGDTERELQSAIAQSEEDIKAWVNKEFYTKSDIDSKLTVIEGSISDGDDGLKAQIDEQKTALADAKTELTTAYQKAITDAITNNNGVIDTKISDAITAAKKDYDSKINDISARLDTLAAQVEKNKDDIADILKRLDELEAENQVLKNQIRCLKDDHDWDATKTTLAWNDDLSACDLHVECLNCGGKFDVIQSDLVLSGNILTAKFDDMFKQEDQTLDLTDTTKLTNSQIQGAMVHLVGDGTADSVDITLTLAEGAGSKVFDAIRNGLSGAKDGSVNLTLNGAKEIPNSAFKNCTALGSITLAEGVTTINNSAFYGCKSLKSIEFPSTLTDINTSAFVNSGLTSITIPDTVKNIGENVFKNCTSLKTVTIGKGITTIPKQTFYKCTALESVTIPSTVTEIGQQAFYQCSSLASISIPSGVTTIGANAFCGTALTAVTIPNSVTSVGEGMFKYCSQLKTVVLGSGVSTIGRNFFAACSSLESITFFGEIKSLSRSNVFNSNDTEKITLNFAQDQRVLTVVDANYWGVASGASYVREITDEDAKKDFCGYKFKNIYTWAFADLSDLTTDEIEKTVGSMVSIGYRDISISVPSDNTADCFTAINNAISGQVNGSICLMISGDGSKGIDIGSEAFAKCYALGYLIIGDGINTIGEHAFYDCRYLKSLTITGSVNSIGDSTFYGCSKLTEVTLPKSIEYLGKGIFNQCNNFTDGTISYAGTMEEWKSINKFHDVDGDRYWTWLSNITKVKCTDGTLSGDDVT